MDPCIDPIDLDSRRLGIYLIEMDSSTQTLGFHYSLLEVIAPDAAVLMCFIMQALSINSFYSEVNGINMNHCRLHELFGHEAPYSLQICAAKRSVKHQGLALIEVQIWKSIKSYQPQPS